VSDGKISFYFMGDRGMERKRMTRAEYDEILRTIYDKENILNYVEDELLSAGVNGILAAVASEKAKKDKDIYNYLVEFMRETDKTKRQMVVGKLAAYLEDRGLYENKANARSQH
jgi:hypothetical protein